MSYSTFLSTLTNRISSVCKAMAGLRERRIVSKPQLLSRLRYVNIVENCDETPQERNYRLKYEMLQDWNNEYWSANNELFEKEKKQYIIDNYGDSISEEEALTHDQLAPFYRSFLERNRDKHVNYNKVWYQAHVALLGSSLNAKLSRLKVNMTSQRPDRESHTDYLNKDSRP